METDSSLHWIPFPGSLQIEPAGSARRRSAPPLLEGFLVGTENYLAQTVIQLVLRGVSRGDLAHSALADRNIGEQTINTTIPFGNLPYSTPIVFYGPAGCGKSHLTGGLYQKYRQDRSDSVGISLTGYEFFRSYTQALSQNDIASFRNFFLRSTIAVFEDIDYLVDRPAAQEELLTLFDHFQSSRALVIITLSKFPSELTDFSPQLISRLIGGTIVPIAYPGPEARKLLTNRFIRAHRLEMSAATEESLLPLLPSSVRGIFGSISQLAQHRIFSGRPLTPKAMRDILTERNNRGTWTIDDIAKKVGKFYSVRLTDMRSKSRMKTVVLSRNVAVYFTRKLTSMTLKEIGKWFGNRDHTTILHGNNDIESRLKEDVELQSAIQELSLNLNTEKQT